MRKRIIAAIICGVFGIMPMMSAYENTADDSSADAKGTAPQRVSGDYLWYIWITDDNGAKLPFYAHKTRDDQGNILPLKNGDSAYFGNFEYYIDLNIGAKKVTIPATILYDSVDLNVVGCGLGWIKEVEEINIEAPIDMSNTIMPNLINYHVSEDNPYTRDIDGVLFTKDRSELLVFPSGRTGTYVVPKETEIIGRPFYSGSEGAGNTFGASQLNELVFEDGSNLRLIRNEPFSRYFVENNYIVEEGAPHLKRVVLPESNNDITLESNVFYISEIEYIYLSKSVKYLQEDCFKFEYYNPKYSSELRGFATIELASDDPSSFVIEGEIFNCPAAITLVVPDGCREKYKHAEYWKECGKILEKSEYVSISNVYSDINITVDGRLLIMSNLASNSTVAIYTIEGQLLTEAKYSGNYTYTFNSSGIYIVRVNNMPRKVLIR